MKKKKLSLIKEAHVFGKASEIVTKQYPDDIQKQARTVGAVFKSLLKQEKIKIKKTKR